MNLLYLSSNKLKLSKKHLNILTFNVFGSETHHGDSE